MFEVFEEGVAQSVCEYNIGSMQKGDGETVADDDAHRLLRLLGRLEPGKALVVIKKEN